MLKDRKRIVERKAADIQRRHQLVVEYAAFLRTLFSLGDWFVTLTFRDRHQDSEPESSNSRAASQEGQNRRSIRRKVSKNRFIKCAPDPRLEAWEPDSRNRPKLGPPVRDAALREIEHWLLELGWEAAGHTRQEIFDHLAEGLDRSDRRNLAEALCKRCLCCAVLEHAALLPFYSEIRAVATRTIGWVIAEEFGRVGGRWHVHLLVGGARHIRRKKCWRRAFVRFGRNRIEPIHG